MDLGFLKDGKHGAEVVEEFLKNPVSYLINQVTLERQRDLAMQKC